MKTMKRERGLKPGDRVVTPDGVAAEVLEVQETRVLVRYVPGESRGIYAPEALRSQKEVSD